MHFSGWEKIGFAVLVAAWVTFGSNLIGNALVQTDTLEKSAYQVIAQGDAEKGDQAIKEVSAVVENALTLLASADPERGKKVFKKCKACHSADEGGKNKVGPNLWDIVGRAKGAAAGFKYSGAMTEKGGDWAYQDLDSFLTNPKSFVSGTKMSFSGLKKAADRAAVIAYLRTLSAAPKSLP